MYYKLKVGKFNSIVCRTESFSILSKLEIEAYILEIIISISILSEFLKYWKIQKTINTPCNDSLPVMYLPMKSSHKKKFYSLKKTNFIITMISIIIYTETTNQLFFEEDIFN